MNVKYPRLNDPFLVGPQSRRRSRSLLKSKRQFSWCQLRFTSTTCIGRPLADRMTMSHRLPSFMFARGRPGLGFLPDHQTMCANDNSETDIRRLGSPSRNASSMVETTYLSTPTSVIHQPPVQRSYRLFASCIPSRSRSATGIVFPLVASPGRSTRLRRRRPRTEHACAHVQLK